MLQLALGMGIVPLRYKKCNLMVTTFDKTAMLSVHLGVSVRSRQVLLAGPFVLYFTYHYCDSYSDL